VATGTASSVVLGLTGSAILENSNLDVHDAGRRGALLKGPSHHRPGCEIAYCKYDARGFDLARGVWQIPYRLLEALVASAIPERGFGRRQHCNNLGSQGLSDRVMIRIRYGRHRVGNGYLWQRTAGGFS
jgi:hypothetical protein